MILSYKYRVYPNRAQVEALGDMLADFCELYNAALQQRIEARDRRGKSLSYLDQAAELKATREAHGRLGKWSFSAAQQILRRLDKAYKAFFSRVAKGQKPGFPRFRAKARFHAADFRVGDGVMIRKSTRLTFVGVPGEIKVKWHRSLPSEPKSAILTRQDGKWYIVFHVEVTQPEIRPGLTIGIDAGLSSLVALSDGTLIERPNWTKRAAKKLRRLQRAAARCGRHSRNHRKAKSAVARCSSAIARRRRSALHALSSQIVAKYPFIAVEGLNIRGLSRGILAREIHDASWANLIEMLSYKAANAGGGVIKVDPRGTSQTCPSCGTIRPKKLSERWHSCECGCELDRDVSAAQIVHLRAFGPGNGLWAPSERVTAELAQAALGLPGAFHPGAGGVVADSTTPPRA